MWNEERCCDISLAAQTRDLRSIVNPAEHRERLALRVLQAPKIVYRRSSADAEAAGRPGDITYPGTQPLQETRTGGHNRDEQPRIDIRRVPERVVPIGVRHDRPIAVNATAKKIWQPFIRYPQWAETQTLCRHEPDCHEPPVKHEVAPLQPVTGPWVDAHRDASGDAKTSPNGLQEIVVLGRHRQMPTVLRQTAVGRHQPHRIGELSGPPSLSIVVEWRAVPRPRQRPSTPGWDPDVGESPRDRRRRQSEVRSDPLDRQAPGKIQVTEVGFRNRSTTIRRSRRRRHRFTLATSPAPINVHDPGHLTARRRTRTRGAGCSPAACPWAGGRSATR
jgi:hypothetical protein